MHRSRVDSGCLHGISGDAACLTMLEKDTLEVVGLILARPFYTTSEKETFEVVGLTLERPVYTASEKETLEVVGSIWASHFLL